MEKPAPLKLCKALLKPPAPLELAEAPDFFGLKPAQTCAESTPWSSTETTHYLFDLTGKTHDQIWWQTKAYGTGIQKNMVGKPKLSSTQQKTWLGYCGPQGDRQHNIGGATTGSFHKEVSRWLHPAPPASVQPVTDEWVEDGELLPVMPMQNKCTQKWHRWRKITVCFKARKTVTKNCLQRIMQFSSARHYFLHSAQLADIIPSLFKAHRFLGQQVRKQTSKRAADTSFFCCQFRDIQNTGGKGASGFS